MPEASPNLFLTRPCPACGAIQGSILTRLCFALPQGSPLPEDYCLVACPDCGLVFYDTSARQADYDRYYRENLYYQSAATAGSGGDTPQERERYERIVEIISQRLPQSANPAVFDVGCGKGGLLRTMAEAGYKRLYGVDMLPACVECACCGPDITAQAGSALELPFPEVRADLLIYSHLIEHILDLQDFVSQAQAKLNPGGLIYVETPDLAGYGGPGEAPYQRLYLEHLNHFDAASLRNLFSRAGFSVLQKGAYEMKTSAGVGERCLWAVLQKGLGKGRSLPQNNSSRRNMADYLAWSEGHPFMAKLAELAEGKSPLVIWGVSQLAMLLMGMEPLNRARIAGLVDIDPYKQSLIIGGMVVQAPRALKEFPAEYQVLAMAPGHGAAIAAQARQLGPDRKVWGLKGQAL